MRERQPSREELTAYADGELPAGDRAEVEAWLAKHPEDRAEVQAQRQLVAWWQRQVPSEPEPARWKRVLQRIWAEVQSPPRGHRRARAWLWGLAGLASAAALLLAVLLARIPDNGSRPSASRPQPLPLVSAQEVEILSMDDADRAALIVGEPPVTGPLVVVAAGDVVLDNVQPHDDGMVPRFDEAGPHVPMLWPPDADGREP
jgi:anti-sigma factor RsiW